MTSDNLMFLWILLASATWLWLQYKFAPKGPIHYGQQLLFLIAAICFPGTWVAALAYFASKSYKEKRGG